MRIANIVLAAVLVFFAVLQYNDPDLVYWGGVYLLAALWCILAVGWPRLLVGNALLRGAAFASAALFLVGFAWLAPTIGADWIHVEEARESIGYLICATATIVAILGARGVVGRGDATVGRAPA